MRTVRTICTDYVLEHELAETSADQYHRIVGVFVSWAGRDVSSSEFTPQLVSEFLADRQRLGRSSYYRKSLRNHLVALLRYAGQGGRVRAVKLHELEPQAWTPEEVAALVAACDCLPLERRAYWQTIIPVAYHTGLGQCDLERIERRHFDHAGVIRFSRSKTGKRILAQIPMDLLKRIPMAPGPIWPRTVSKEHWRRTFGKIVRKAGLTGTFKKLRKTAGTLVDAEHPGQGHVLLGNSRQIFERHYRDPRTVKENPLSPPGLPRPDSPKPAA